MKDFIDLMKIFLRIFFGIILFYLLIIGFFFFLERYSINTERIRIRMLKEEIKGVDKESLDAIRALHGYQYSKSDIVIENKN